MKQKSLGLIAVALVIMIQARSQEINLSSGLDIGKDCPAFDPVHITGPDKGTKACPMCKYGNQQGVMIWMNDNDWDNMGKLAAALEKEISEKGLKRRRVFLMYMNPDKKSKQEIQQLISAFANKNGLDKIALTYIPAPTDAHTAGSYKINPDRRVRNTIIVYKSRGVFAKYINFEATAPDIGKLIAILDKAERAKSF